jgi:hypothetical protein
VRQIVREHRTWLTAALADLLRRAGNPDPEGGARQLAMLRDGAMVGGYLDNPKETTAALTHAIETLTR